MIEKKAVELIFISQVNRNGIGTSEVHKDYLNSMITNDLMKDELFKLHRLSLSEDTWIALGFNTFVVKLK